MAPIPALVSGPQHQISAIESRDMMVTTHMVDGIPELFNSLKLSDMYMELI